MKRLLLLALVLSSTAAAQDTLVLSLDQSIALALKQGYAVKNASAQYLSSKKSYESSLRQLRTSVNLSLDAPNFSQSLSSQFNPISQQYEFYQIKTTQLAGTLSINQPLVWTGGTFSFRQYLFGRDQLSGLQGTGNTRRDFFSNFQISFRQPLITPNLLQISEDRALISMEQNRSEFARNQMDIVYNLTEAFYSAYQLAQRLEIARETVNQNEDSYETARGKFNAGLIPEVDVLQSEVDLVSSRNDQLSAERELASALNTLRLLVGLPLEKPVKVTASLAYLQIPVDMQKAIDAALKNRAEVKNASSTIDLRKMDIDAAESKNGFRIDMTATYGLNKSDVNYRTLFQDFGTSRSAAVTLSIPLFDWGSNRLEVESAEIQYQNAIATRDYVREQIRQEITDLVNRIKVAESRIQVLEKSVAVAQKGYDISLERFKSGNINRNDLTLAQQRLTNAKVSNLNALIEYQIGLADLQRRTLWDFKDARPITPITDEDH